MSKHDPASSEPEDARTVLARRIRQVMTIDPSVTALTFGEQTFAWSFFAEAVDDLETLLADHPSAMRIGVVLRNRPGPVSAVVATLASGRSLITLSPHLGDVGLAEDVVELAPDLIVAEAEDWARGPLVVAAEAVGALAASTSTTRGLSAGGFPRRCRGGRR